MSRHSQGQLELTGSLETDDRADAEDKSGVDADLRVGDALEKSVGSAEDSGRNVADGSEQAGGGSGNLLEGAGEGALCLGPELSNSRVEKTAEEATKLVDLLLRLVVQRLGLGKNLRVVSIL